MNKYDDIINLQRPISKYHKPMSIQNRASQFSSFDALNGYKDVIVETNRYVSNKIELTDEKKYEINDILNIINLKNNPHIKIIYFVKDKYKNGGIYTEKEGTLKKIDTVEKTIILSNNIKINIDDIIQINEE